MNITDYITTNWATLPKSTFNNKEVVIFETACDSDEGWGHHDYEGYGVTKDGKVVVCTSSGCSCNGDCDVSDSSLVEIKSTVDIDYNRFNPEFIDFNKHQVEFSDY